MSARATGLTFTLGFPGMGIIVFVFEEVMVYVGPVLPLTRAIFLLKEKPSERRSVMAWLTRRMKICGAFGSGSRECEARSRCMFLTPPVQDVRPRASNRLLIAP